LTASRFVSELPRETRINLSIGLPLRNQDQLDALIADLTDPTSPRYRQYLTPTQFAAQFGPTQQDYQAVIDFAEAHHLQVTATHPNRTVLSVSGSAPDIEAAFNLHLNLYQHPTRGQFFAADSEPTLPPNVLIQDISGLDNFALPQPMDLHVSPLTPGNPQLVALTTGSGPNGLFLGTDYRNAYAPGVTLTGSGQTIGLLEFDGFYAGDATKNFAAANLPPVPISATLLDGFTGAPGKNNIEVILDVMMAAYMAPGAAGIVVYEGTLPNDILNRMATDGFPQLSSSWTFNGLNATTENIFKQFQAQGQSFFQASGDSGAYTNGIYTPADDPSLTIVGGTNLTTSGPGGAWLSESAWSDSGGGVSTKYPIPTWQVGLNLGAKGGSNTMRNIPDVAMIGAVQNYLICNNGVPVEIGGTSAAAPLWAGFLALANQQAIANGAATIGFLNTNLYNIGNSGNYANDFHDILSGSNGAFRALAGYDLTTGWGSPTGQPLINALTNVAPLPYFSIVAGAASLTLTRPGTADTTITITPYNGFTSPVTYTITGLPSGVTATINQSSSSSSSTLVFTASSTAKPGTYNVFITGTSISSKGITDIGLVIPSPTFTLASSVPAISLNTGQYATATITATPINSFAGVITYSTTGLPQGVTARFSPVLGSVATPTTLTITVPANATGGIYTVNVIGTSGPLVVSTPITLTIIKPTFSLTAADPALTLTAGSTVTTTISATAINGFDGNITFSAVNLPGGVTAAFSPASAPAGTPTTLTLTAAPTSPASTVTIAVIGASGFIAVDTPIAITVIVPGFTLAASASTVNITSKPSNAAVNITSTAINGLTGPIAYTAVGMPAGVTATFSPTPADVGTTTTLTLTVSTTAAAGTYTVTVKGTSGVATATTNISLIISAPSFSLDFSPSSIIIQRGNYADTVLTVTPLGTFTGTVSLSASGLPTGMTLSTLTASSTSDTFKFSTTNTISTGTYTILMTGTSPNTTAQTATLTVTVTN